MAGIVETRACWKCGVQTPSYAKCSACGAPMLRPWQRNALIAGVVLLLLLLAVSAGR